MVFFPYLLSSLFHSMVSMTGNLSFGQLYSLRAGYCGAGVNVSFGADMQKWAHRVAPVYTELFKARFAMMPSSF
jgi:hypothetical protein